MDDFFRNLAALIIKAKRDLAASDLPPSERIARAFKAVDTAYHMIADIPSGSVITSEALRAVDEQ